MNCRQPGCFGTIADGYCDVCGMPPSTAPAPAPDAPGLAGADRRRGKAVPRPVPTGPLSPAPQQSPQPGALQWQIPAGIPQGSAPRGGPSAVPPAAPEAGVQCGEPGCAGFIVDGYCNVCGNALSSGAKPVFNIAFSTRLPSLPIGSGLLDNTDQAKRPAPSAHRKLTRIGAGVTNVPPAPLADPLTAIMAHPVVPETRRFCPSCSQAIGRSEDGKPGSTHGTCPGCQAPFDFEPSIKPGEVLANQYEVVGCLAFGGMGWIYLARDRNVSDRLVVLKGLLNKGDKDAYAAALSEQEFLAQLEHPLIVEIYNFITHNDARYIVMEYVPGRSLKDLLKQRMVANGGVAHPLPVEWALAYLIEILPAFTYLHERGLVYCDFKPDNVMQVEDTLKMIDLGGVRRLDDDDAPLFGTVGFQAPELATDGASVASDIYTIGRTLLVLCCNVPGYQGEFATTLPSLLDLPELAAAESAYRLIQRCCAPRAVDRFTSADEVRQQAIGVLREVVRVKSGATATSSESSAFFDPVTQSGNHFDPTMLPRLRPDTTDPMSDWLSQLMVINPVERLLALQEAPMQTAEVLLAQVDLLIGMGYLAGARVRAHEIGTNNPWDWRSAWVQGVVALTSEDPHLAVAAFNTVYSQLPGELAVKYALAVACEQAAHLNLAEQLYRVCLTTDAQYVTPAAFGLARVKALMDDRQGAIDALWRIPTTSRGFAESRLLLSKHLMEGGTLRDMANALDAVAAARLDRVTYLRNAVTIFKSALDIITASGGDPHVLIGGQPALADNLRAQLEAAYRSLAGSESDDEARVELVENANKNRKWSLL